LPSPGIAIDLVRRNSDAYVLNTGPDHTPAVPIDVLHANTQNNLTVFGKLQRVTDEVIENLLYDIHIPDYALRTPLSTFRA
jgi:hypothetical protein